MNKIDATARVADGAQIGDGVTIGPYCVIGPNVSIGANCQLSAHVNIAGRTTIGARTRISAFASLGTAPQSVHYHGEDTALVIGADCDIREHVTMNIGTAERGVTRVGDHGLFMVGSHVAHDCIVGHHVVFANNATLGGFVEIGDHVFLGGLCAIHQFTRVGTQVVVGGMTGVAHDVIPYTAVIGDRGKLAGLNRVGLKRRGFTNAQIQTIYRAYRTLFFGTGTLTERTAVLAEEFAGDSLVAPIIEFIGASKSRRLMVPRSAERQSD